jgi:exopolysaccharide production protein ExoQ
VHSILASKTVMVTVFTVLFAGDLVRYALTVPVWIALVFASTVWGVAVLWARHVSWRSLPVPLLLVFAWWAVSPAWSPYAASSLVMMIPAVITVLLGLALVTAVETGEALRRAALSLRIILVGSILFEFAVGIIGRPVYPVGLVATESTPIEMAWSRALFFTPGGRIQGLVGNANLLGMLALVLLIIAVWRMYASRNGRTLFALDVVVALFLVARTMSATVTIALAGVVVVVGIAALARKSGVRWRVALWTALTALTAGIGVVFSQWDAVTSLLGRSPDLTHRFDIWNAVLERIVDQPFVGYGYVGWWPSWDSWFAIHSIDGVPMLQAHNVWLDLVMQTGLIGALLFAVALGALWWPLFRAFVMSPRSSATVPFLILTALTIQSLSESRMLIEWGFASIVAFGVVAKRMRTGVTATS